MKIEPLETRIAPALLYALTSTNQLLSFDSDTPGTLTTLPLTGLAAGQALRGIDFRPETSELYAMSVTDGSAANSSVNIYRVNPLTGALSFVGATVPLPGAADVPTGFDFNPVVDRMRYVNTNDENARFNPNTGSLAGDDTDLTPAASTDLIGVAYDRNFANAPVSTLYAIDRSTSALARQGGEDGNPTQNGGVVTDIGPLGITLSATADGGFDIENTTGTAYAALTGNDTVTRLYTINLTTGQATLVGIIGAGTSEIYGLTAAPPQAIRIVNSSTATYVDQEGDLVTVKVSKGTLDASNFRMAFKSNGGLELHLLDLTAAEFALANVTIKAKKTSAGGDGFAQVGRIDATGRDLGTVTIGGDLSQVDAGDGNATKPALKTLTARSLGVANVGVRIFPDAASALNGDLGSLNVKLDIQSVSVVVTGNIGKVTIGGSLHGGSGVDSGLVSATGNIGTVKVGGSIIGGAGAHSGAVDAGGTLGSVKIGGSIYGGTASNSGLVESTLDMGTVFIGGNVIGGSDDHTGTVHGDSSIKAVTVVGSIIGGTLTVPGEVDSGLVYAFGSGTNNIGSVKVGGSLIGANGNFSGIYADNHLASVSIGGSLRGDLGAQSGTIEAESIGKAMIRGDVVGGAGLRSGTIWATSAGGLGSLTIKGSLFATTNVANGIIVGGPAGTIKIGGEVRGLGTVPVLISVLGTLAPADAAAALAVKSITIARGVTNALILGGYDVLTAANPDAQIGSVTVGRDWVASSLVTGAATGTDNFFGTADDISVTDGDGDGVIARISKIVIKGSVVGTYLITDHFAFVAHEIGSVMVGGRKVPLTAGPANDGIDNVALIVTATGDVRVREVLV